MKIIYLHQYFKFPDESGGTRSYDLSKGFVKEGYSVDVITTTSEEKYKNNKGWFLISRENINVHYLYLPYDNKMSYQKRIMTFIKFVWLSTFKMHSIEADIIIATSTPLTIGIPALLTKWLKKTPFIFEIRDVWPEAVIAIGAIRNKYIQKLLYKLEYLIYKNAQSLVVLSSDMKKSIVNRYPQINKRIEIIENISEISRFQKIKPEGYSILDNYGIPKSRYIVLYAGTFGRVNGLKYAVSLAEKTLALDPTLIYVLVGDGIEKKEIIKISEDKGILNKNLYILDSIAKEELPQLYSEANLGSSFVIDIPELSANSANKFFDTLAAGKPILINYGGWQKEVINKDDIGHVLPPILDDKSILDFVEYTKNDSLQSKQKKKALEKAINSYSLEIATSTYISILKGANNV